VNALADTPQTDETPAPPAPPDTTAVATDAEDEPRNRGGAPSRSYVVLEEIELDGDGVAYQRVIFANGDDAVDTRNGQNALRKAFKQLRVDREGSVDAATLAVIPAGQWKPTPVRAERKESITVNVG
jgi:hypothetical protein